MPNLLYTAFADLHTGTVQVQRSLAKDKTREPEWGGMGGSGHKKGNQG